LGKPWIIRFLAVENQLLACHGKFLLKRGQHGSNPQAVYY
jgi:hypothetical protein